MVELSLIARDMTESEMHLIVKSSVVANGMFGPLPVQFTLKQSEPEDLSP